jgi:hypothetical protein
MSLSGKTSNPDQRQMRVIAHQHERVIVWLNGTDGWQGSYGCAGCCR